MSGLKSRNKGKRNERKARDFWRDKFGLQDVRRSQQFRGSGVSADLDGTLRFHTEIKTGKKTPDIYAAIKQATEDSSANKFPLVQLQRDREQWLFVMPEETFIHVINRYMMVED